MKMMEKVVELCFVIAPDGFPRFWYNTCQPRGGQHGIGTDNYLHSNWDFSLGCDVEYRAKIIFL